MRRMVVGAGRHDHLEIRDAVDVSEKRVAVVLDEMSDDVCLPAAIVLIIDGGERIMNGVVAALVRLIDVCTVVEKLLDNRPAVATGRPAHERDVVRWDPTAIGEQQGAGGRAVVTDRVDEGVPFLVVENVEVCVVADKEALHGRDTVAYDHVQRRLTVVVLCVDVCFDGEQEGLDALGHFDEALSVAHAFFHVHIEAGVDVHWVGSIRKTARVDVSPAFDESFGHVVARSGAGNVQGRDCVVAHVCLAVCIDVGLVGDHQIDNTNVAVFDCAMKVPNATETAGVDAAL